MKTKTIKKNQKPIDIEAHLKYVCPIRSCGFEHWLSLNEAQTKNFKVVCECGCIFKPKQIKKLKILYKQIIKSSTDIITAITVEDKSNIEQPPTVEKIEIPVDLSNECVKLLIAYGFTKQESVVLSSKAFSKTGESNSSNLVKYILQNLIELESE